MPPTLSSCNGTDSGSACGGNSTGVVSLPVLGGDPSVDPSNGTGSNNFNSTATAIATNATITGFGDSEDEDVIWVPYVTLVCLVIVIVTLGYSFTRHWRRAKKRQTNIQDYLEHNIDLKRKRLFGMMRMPFDIYLDSRPSSFEDSGNWLSSKARGPNHQHQNRSYDFLPPRSEVTRGGFGRDESLCGSISGGYCRNAHDFQRYSSASGEQGQLCHHHCVVSCQVCWKALQSELHDLLVACQEEVQGKREMSRNNRIQEWKDSKDDTKRYYEDKHKKVKTVSERNGGSFKTLKSGATSYLGKNDRNARFDKEYRPEEGIEYGQAARLSPYSNGAIPKTDSKYGPSIWPNKRWDKGGNHDLPFPPTTHKYTSHDQAHSDSELMPDSRTASKLQRLEKQVSFGEERTFSRQMATDECEFPQVSRLSLASSSCLLPHPPPHPPPKGSPHSPRHPSPHPSPRPNDNESNYMPKDPPSRYSHLVDVHSDNNNNNSSSSSSATNDGRTSADVTSHGSAPTPDALTGNGGVINYGFQSDSCHSLHSADTASTTLDPGWSKSNSFPECTSPSKLGDVREGSKRKKKPFLKSQHPLVELSMTTSSQHDIADTVLPLGSVNLWPAKSELRQGQRIDLSVIDIDNGAFGQTASPSADSLTTGHPYNGHGDVNV